MKRQPWFRLAAGVAALSLLAAACGDDSDDSDDTAADPGDEDFEPVDGDPDPVDGFDGETITLGALTPTSGTVAIIGDPLTAGNQAYIDYVNEELGGVAGTYQLELEVEDSAYDPSTASQAYPGMRDDVVMFVQLLGTPIVDALLGDLEDDDVVAAPASLDSFWVREPNLLPIGAPYQIQAINAIDWYYAEEGDEDDVLCALASDDEYGDAGMQGVEFAADGLGIDLAAEVDFPAPGAERPAQTFGPQISELQGADCDVVFFVATATDTGAFADALAQESGFDPVILGQSPTWLGLFSDNEYMQENFIILAEGPEWGDESHEGMVELMRIRDEYAPDQVPDVYFNFGVNQARAAHQVLEVAVANGDLSREGILDAMEQVGTLTFDGLQGDYVYGESAEDRVPPIGTSVFRPSAEHGGEAGTGLELIVQDYQSDLAGEFEFE
jgi:ABC-type branched-subunit amino acid transport system substrate-binding protein